MDETQKAMTFESSFDIDKLSFDNVSEDFESKFRRAYRRSLEKMSDSRNRLDNSTGTNTLGILEKMGQQISTYDRRSDFEQCYHDLIKEYEPFTET
jgi:hypothetical protein